MTQRWSENQVTALAPDTSSLTAARKLAGKWSGTGWSGTTLWGLCKGSGQTPYQTIVDLAGPAFRCSCPSRKFPCKHALSLLLIWSAGTVAESAETADFAAEWIGRRAAKAAAPPKQPRGSDPATAQQRQERVKSGLAELDTWLTDQIRTGLAQTDRSHAAFEAVAARLVDAQAPGPAAAVRRLPDAVVRRANWPEVLLGRFAWLHLLITAHTRSDTLPAPLAAAVRGHIGYPVPAETVQAEPAVTDRWLTVGMRTEQEDRLHTRRTWLHGMRTGRWALLVEHSFGSPVFPANTPPIGLAAEYAVHFYPVAAPLRAMAGSARDEAAATPAEPAETAGSGTVAAALTDFATAAAADPWLESWPVLLRGVTPVRQGEDWLIGESDGTALPLAEPAQPWRLLALSGGRPVTVFGLWTGRRLELISVLADGDFHDAGPAADAAGSAVAATPEAASIALLGTARGAGTPSGIGAQVAAAVAALPERDAAQRLLATTALEMAWARGGYLPRRVEVSGAPAADDPRPELPRAAADRLALLIESRPEFLPEWFAAAAPHEYRAPHRLVGPLLEFAAGNGESREAALRLAGARGRWLAEWIPRWHDLARRDTAEPEPTEETWHLGRPPERIAWLAALRHRDPAAARTALTEAWPRESGAPKAELLGVLADGLSAADEELLERALGDRRGDVRRTAAELLARLPASAFAARMAARAADWIKCGETGAGQGSELFVGIPETLDESATRDGFTDGTTEFGYRWNGQPDLAATRLRKLVAALPLSYWTGPLGSPVRAVVTHVDDRFRQPLFDGWMDAALAQRDTRWGEALFTAGMPSNLAILRRRELFALLPAGDQLRHLLRLGTSWLSELESLLPAVAHPWPPELARHLLRLFEERARTAAARRGAPGTYPSAHRSLLHTATLHLPPECAGEVTALAGRCEADDWAAALGLLAHDLHQRSAMLEELK
ncbi:SWIM zinc finger family protein [Nocardia zapadnayensis]|uniref:SWIM zinc finger family protein n=1 Tax=Nocardia rhamnosiphila TaxID=426716 RepID=UPI002247A3E1|nr:SWIM zinc finger family protein [Nocardia zapadnayensis]MCX0271385.1 SWIM zinc finger family protein [Nocardia zapadnayensis]